MGTWSCFQCRFVLLPWTGDPNRASSVPISPTTGPTLPPYPHIPHEAGGGNRVGEGPAFLLMGFPSFLQATVWLRGRKPGLGVRGRPMLLCNKQSYNFQGRKSACYKMTVRKREREATSGHPSRLWLASEPKIQPHCGQGKAGCPHALCLTQGFRILPPGSCYRREGNQP